MRKANHCETADAIITPRKGPRDPVIPSKGLLLISPHDAKQAITLAVAKQGRRFPLFNSNLCVVSNESDKSGYFIAGPAVGAPMAVMTLEKLVALGARQVIVYGWCGSLHETLKGGDIFLPSWTISEEGTSCHYSSFPNSRADEALLDTLKKYLFEAGHSPLVGPLWTTDAPYRETRKKVLEYSQRGVLAVDMEFSALCTVASYRGCKIAAIMLVSDELWHPDWKPMFMNKSVTKKKWYHLELAIDVVKNLGELGL